MALEQIGVHYGCGGGGCCVRILRTFVYICETKESIMKRFLLFAASMMLCCIVNAQVKGEKYIRVGLNLSAGSQETTVQGQGYSTSKPLNTEIGIGTEFGYFVVRGLRVSLAIGYVYEDMPYENINGGWSKLNVNEFDINPNVAYYVSIVNGLWYTPEVGGTFGFGNVKIPGAYGKNTYSANAWNVYLNMLSFEVAVSNHFSLDFSFGSLGYTSGLYKDVVPVTYGDSRTNTFKFILNRGSVGVKFYL